MGGPPPTGQESLLSSVKGKTRFLNPRTGALSKHLRLPPPENLCSELFDKGALSALTPNHYAFTLARSHAANSKLWTEVPWPAGSLQVPARSDCGPFLPYRSLREIPRGTPASYCPLTLEAAGQRSAGSAPGPTTLAQPSPRGQPSWLATRTPRRLPSACLSE